MPVYCDDFETTTLENDCRVWAWACCDIDDIDNIAVSNTIDSYISYISEKPGIHYFHNLKFDGNFIVYYLLTHNYKWRKDKRTLEPGEFTTSISDMGSWYIVVIRFLPNDCGVSYTVEIRDSLKLIPVSIEDMPKTFGLSDEQKLTIDYHELREKGHILTEQEEAYVKADVRIAAKAVKFMLEHGQKKLTTASNALNDFKSRFDRKEWKRLFPELNAINDKDIRASYKGGWTYLNPLYKNKDVAEGSVYDVNSMYPWAMKYCLLPYGSPCYFAGEYKPNKNYPLYIINFLAEFKLKPGKYPSIQLKHTMFYSDNEYISESLTPTVLTLTSVDYELFLELYDVNIIEFYGGYMFKAKYDIFTEYIDDWYGQKVDSKKDHNPGLEKIAKLMLNSLYGKFGARRTGANKEPYYDADNDIVRYKLGPKEDRKGGYLPIATFITSYCRDKIIRAACTCGDRFIYADTDSVHISGYEPVDGLDIDDFRLGAFKLEEKFIRARFIRQKTYMEIYLDKQKKEIMNLKCCGMPQRVKDTVEEDDFYEGAEFDATKNPKFKPKLTPHVVPGGVILRETTFKIKKSVTRPVLNVV